jgi:hypothetical protein
VCEYAEEALALAAVVGAPGHGAAEPALVSGKGALGLPPLTEHALGRVPSARGRKCRGIWDRYRPFGGASLPRGLIGMTDERIPNSSRAWRWCASESNAASASTRSQAISRDANSRTGVNCGESLAGPSVTTAPAMKCERVSNAAVSLGQLRAVCSPLLRATKYREACRLSSPVASTATVGCSGISSDSTADVTVPSRRSMKIPLLRADPRRN